MEQPRIEQKKTTFTLEDAFRLYHKNFISTAENELRRQGIKNYSTIAPDVVQNAYLSFQRARQSFHGSKTEFCELLNRFIQSGAEHYVRLQGKINPKHPTFRRIRDSGLVPLEKASHIFIEPNQEKVDLATLIEGVENITPLQKKILIKEFIEGKTGEEIAEELNFNSSQAVRQHKYKALKTLARNPKFKFLLHE